MKKIIGLLFLQAISFAVFSQSPWSGTNTTDNTSRTGNVSIGTTSATQKLNVGGQGVFLENTASADPGDGVGPALRIGFTNGYGYINANHTGVWPKNLGFQINGGNVGIGTTTPSSKLEIVHDASLLKLRGTQFSSKTPLEIVNLGLQGTTGAMNVSFRVGYPYSMGVESGTRLDLIKLAAGNTILGTDETGISLGRVGIGTTTPIAQLDITGGWNNLVKTILPPGAIRFYTPTGTSNTTYPWGLNVNSSGILEFLSGAPAISGTESLALKVSFLPNGKVGIGTSNPIDLLDVTGGWNSIAKTTLSPGGIKFYTPTGTSTTTYPWNINVNSSGVLEFRSGSPSVSGVETLDSKVVFGSNGHVGIGTTNPGSYKLAVEGKIGAREVNVTLASWSDFVFFDSYKLRPLSEVETFIQENKHLPDVPSAAVVEKEGVNLGEMDAILLRKIEELTLYVIELKKENQEMKEKIENLETR